MGGVMGWYSFGHLGWWGVITAGQFAVVGWLLAKSWTSPEKKKSDVSLESQSLSETAISAPIVEQKDTTAKVEGYILSSDVDPTESVEAN